MPPPALLLVALLALGAPTPAQESKCCSLASGSCRSACVQVSLVSLATEASDSDNGGVSLADVGRFCPSEMEDFWQCFNETLEEVAQGAGWTGRPCCPLAQALACRRACATASSRDAVRPACRLSDELPFFACVDRQQEGAECCAGARSADCEAACRAVFRAQHTPTREQRAAVKAACADQSPRVLTCVKEVTRVTPPINSQKQLRCCEAAPAAACREACRRVLRSPSTSSQEMVDALERAGCGPPLPHDSLWQCFLQTADAARADRLGMDAAKMHCCAKAANETCRRLCVKTYSDEWTRYWHSFHRSCLTQLSEDAMAHCIDGVEEPCELGCDGLGYCTNFNNRPTELFRSCGRAADDAARLDVALWQREGALSLPNGLRLPLRNASACSGRRWRAVACALQLRPCHPHTHTDRICRADCTELLSACVDWARVRAGGTAGAVTAAAVCSQLSPDNPHTPCVSLAPFLAPSARAYLAPQDGLLQPCRGEPCNASQACLVNRHCAPGRPCLPYKCVQGCKLGEVSQYVVPTGTYVRLPSAAGGRDCPKVCRCGAHGSMERCQPLSCTAFAPCHLSDHQKIAHNSWFLLGCNMCTCYAGDVTCTKRQCEEGRLLLGSGAPDAAPPSLPCRCPPHHVPVCGRNGNNYPSSCLARCAGLTDVEFEFGACSSRDPCAHVQCPSGQRCMPHRQVCLSLKYHSCPQHECVDISSSCGSQAADPVCDMDGEEHLNLCYLLKNGKTFAYRGPCLEGCEREGEVCGSDGNTYASECAAEAARVPVDYRGPCVAVGFISNVAQPQCSAAGVRCPPLPDEACEGLTPPGACCPVCAGALRLLYSQEQVDRALYGLKGGALSALTVHAVLAALERQVQVAECSVRGYLTVELDLVAVVRAAGRGGRPASPLQREACAREADKLASLVQRAGPRVLSELSLSVLTTASVAHAPVAAATPLPAPGAFLVLGAVASALAAART